MPTKEEKTFFFDFRLGWIQFDIMQQSRFEFQIHLFRAIDFIETEYKNLK